MNPRLTIILVCLLVTTARLPALAAPQKHPGKDTVIIKPAIENNRLNAEWKSALVTRMSRERIDSFGRLERAFTKEEQAWLQLIRSRAGRWNSIRDSIQVPFGPALIRDTVYVLLGYLGVDDGFTFGFQTVCLDLTALQSAYGDATLAENTDRIDRIFAHEYTHLLHKHWAANHQLNLATYRDSIWWECLYEGIGMYRSLNPKWLPVNGELPELTKNTLAKLYPVFVDRLTRIETAGELTNEEKERLHTNLSRGNVPQKWGALPVAIWFVLEAGGNDRNLRAWIDMGPSAVIALAKKYLPAGLLPAFTSVFR